MDCDIIDLLKQLIKSAPTLQRGELEAASVLQRYFLSHGIDSTMDVWDNNRANIVTQMGGDHTDTQTLVIGAHVDVVPAGPENWNSDPFAPAEKDGFVCGRGSVDMLGGIAAVAAALADIQASGKQLSGRLIFAATAGEETDSCGVKRFVDSQSGFIKHLIGTLIPEPTGLRVLRAHRGLLWLKVTTFGKTAHGSMPHLGINAIEKANVLLNRLKTWQILHAPHELLGGCSISINRIQGGSATNIVPDTCSIELDVRLLPEQQPQEIISDVRKLVAEIAHIDPEFKAEISILRFCPALETKADDPFVRQIAEATGIDDTHAIGFTTDAPLFAKLGGPVLILGPGDGARCHQPNEAVEIAQLEKAKAMYKNIILALLS